MAYRLGYQRHDERSEREIEIAIVTLVAYALLKGSRAGDLWNRPQNHERELKLKHPG